MDLRRKHIPPSPPLAHSPQHHLNSMAPPLFGSEPLNGRTLPMAHGGHPKMGEPPIGILPYHLPPLHNPLGSIDGSPPPGSPYRFGSSFSGGTLSSARQSPGAAGRFLMHHRGTPYFSPLSGPLALDGRISFSDGLLPLTPVRQPSSHQISATLRQRILKTKLCVHHLHGRCARGGTCAFAHSVNELRRPPNLYKTRLCTNYANSMSCPKGDMCRFAHGDQELRRTDASDDVHEGRESSESGFYAESPNLMSSMSAHSPGTPMGSKHRGGEDDGAANPRGEESGRFDETARVDGDDGGAVGHQPRRMETEAIEVLLKLPEETRQQLVDLILRTFAGPQFDFLRGGIFPPAGAQRYRTSDMNSLNGANALRAATIASSTRKPSFSAAGHGVGASPDYPAGDMGNFSPEMALGGLTSHGGLRHSPGGSESGVDKATEGASALTKRRGSRQVQTGGRRRSSLASEPTSRGVRSDEHSQKGAHRAAPGLGGESLLLSPPLASNRTAPAGRASQDAAPDASQPGENSDPLADPLGFYAKLSAAAGLNADAVLWALSDRIKSFTAAQERTGETRDDSASWGVDADEADQPQPEETHTRQPAEEPDVTVEDTLRGLPVVDVLRQLSQGDMLESLLGEGAHPPLGYYHPVDPYPFLNDWPLPPAAMARGNLDEPQGVSAAAPVDANGHAKSLTNANIASSDRLDNILGSPSSVYFTPAHLPVRDGSDASAQAPALSFPRSGSNSDEMGPKTAGSKALSRSIPISPN